jgi:TolA-binding protein
LQAFDAKFPDSSLIADARYWLGMSQMAQQQWDQAAKTFTQALAAHPRHKLAPALEFSAGEALRNGGQASAAAEHYDRVAQDWPDSQWADDSLQARIQLAFDGGEHDRLDSLAKEFEQRFANSPLRGIVRQTLGRSLIQRENYSGATSVLEELAQQIGADRSNWYYLALAYLGAQRYQDALAALDRVKPTAEQQQLAHSVLVARSSALVGLQQFAEAVAPLEEYLRAQPDGADAAKCRAQLAVSLGNVQKFDEALKALGELEQGDPKHPLLLPTALYLAEKANGEQQPTAAKRLFEILTRDGNPPEYVAKGLSGLAWIQAKADNAADSAKTFAQLVDQFPDSPLAPEAALMRAKSLEKLGQPDAALETYQRLVDVYPHADQIPEALFGAARLLGQRQQNSQAAALLERLVREHPKFSQMDAVLYQWAWVLVDLNQPEQADEVFARLYEEFQDSAYWADATYRLAERAARAREHDRARQLAAELIATKCDDNILSHALYLQGQLAAADQRWEEVAAPMQQLLDEFPQSSLHLPAEYWVAESYWRMGKSSEANQRFAQLAVKIERRQDAWLAIVPLRRAQVLAESEQWQQAYDMAVSIPERFPEFRQLYEVDYLLGRCLSSQAKFDQARAAYERVIRSPVGGRTETAAMAQWMIGESYFHQQNFDEAIKAYHRVERLYAYPRWQAGALLQAGKCYESKGDAKQAIKLYAQLLKDYPETEFTDEAARRLRVGSERASAGAAPHHN